jgi:hypothetical protein
MSVPCRDLVRFADGELDAELAESFRSHLRTCGTCRAGLIEAMQLGARISTLPPPLEPVKLAPEVPSEAAPGLPLDRAPQPWKPRSRGRRALVTWIATLAAAAAIVAFFKLHRPSPPAALASVFADQTTRPYAIRIAYAGAAAHRPVRDVMLGAAAPSGPAAISYAKLDALQQRNDNHALAIARAWNGDNLTKIAEQLRGLPSTPSVRSDLAAVELLTASKSDVESVLTELEALRVSDDPAVARAAQWNHALLLSQLDLQRSAAQEFQAIASAHEPGWGEEAQVRGSEAERLGKAFQERWKDASVAGEALLTTGAPVRPGLGEAFPGLMRAYFYNAVRTAPTRERVLALMPLAAELDRHSAQPVLGDYVRQIASSDFRRRAPLADAYGRLLRHAPLTPELTAALTTSVASRDVLDIVMGATVEMDAVGDHIAAFRRMVKQTDDPWFEVLLGKEEAALELKRGNWLGAEARLRQTEKLCADPGVTYKCLELARSLAVLYQSLHRIPESLAVVRSALETARSAGEWGLHRRLLWLLSDIERFHGATATARAYAGEVLIIAADRCDFQRSAYQTLAGAALLDVDGHAARGYLEAGLLLHCASPDLPTANLLTDIGRLDPQNGDLARLQGWTRTLRGSDKLTAAERVLVDEIEGRLLIERDRAAGVALLERAITAATALPREVGAEKARAGAYSVLIFDAARLGDHARTIGLIAEALGLPRPASCAVGMVAEDERAVVVVRGADGHDHGSYEAARRAGSSAPIVSEDLAQPLDGCARVQVLALASLQGQPHVLPPRLAWSYATGAHRSARTADAKPAPTRTLIVANVTPPAYLQLPPLSAPPQDLAASSVTLSGPDATPTRVLASMADATEVQFHTHALVAVGVSDASHLVLAAEPDGRYALTAETIRSTDLRGHPVIVLAACHSAQGARYQHAAWSLPDAFLAVGARAVFASATEIPDRDAEPFFARVLARVHDGAAPATALRDERAIRLAANPRSWVADVIVFE